MGLMTVSPKKYGGLLAKAQPKVIENDKELSRFAEMLENLDRVQRPLTVEERTLETLLAQLIREYDDRTEIPSVPANEVLAFLMEQRGLKQADLLTVFGSRSVVSEVLNGKRELSKSHIRKLAEYFRLSPAVFF
jgi:HTH-type transcriptional regulator / antitoxin HigA